MVVASDCGVCVCTFVCACMCLYVCVFGFEGTPPRVDGRTINTSCLTEQPGDDPPTPFSFLNERRGLEVEQKSCFLTYTNAATHQIVHEGMHLNRHVTEETTGPRYY